MKTHLQKTFGLQESDDNRMRSFAFFSANLYKLIPGIPFEQHGELFVKAEEFVKLATDDTLHRQWLATNAFKSLDALRTAQPGIIATYHTGPYRLLPMWLAHQGVPLTLLVSTDVVESQGADYQAWYQRLARDTQGTGFGILEAEDSLVARKMIRALRDGHHLLIYVDGNMGGPQRRQHIGSIIDFLSHRIHARTGAAQVASLANVPVYVVGSYFGKEKEPRFEVFPAIVPAESAQDRKTTIAVTMNTIYRRLEQMIEKSPMQWEGWFYVHGDIVREDVSSAITELFRLYMPFKVKNQAFLLHKGTLNVYRLPDRLYSWLQGKLLLP